MTTRTTKTSQASRPTDLELMLYADGELEGERLAAIEAHLAQDEAARHKLLDLIGDAYLHGGPPIGRVRAHRPGHAANHAAFARAKELGVIVARRA